MGTFKHAAPLGSFCFSSAILWDRKIRKEALPFDWLFTNPLEVAHILETDFKHYLDKTQYIDIADIAPEHGGRQAGHKMYHENFFNHKNPRTDEDYQYSIRCVERFRKFLQYPEKKLFIVSYRSGINTHTNKFENVGLNKTQVQQELMVLDKVLQSKTQNYSIFCHVNYKSQFNYPSSSLFKLSNHIILHEYYSTQINGGLGYDNPLDKLTFDNLFDSIAEFK